MSIFRGLAHDSGEKAIREGSGALLDAADQAGLTNGPWSIAELRLDEEDLDWLQLWMVAASPSLLKRCLNSWHDAGVPGHQLHFQAATGLLCMALFAEVGRRHATEGWLWGRVVKHTFADDPPEALFVAGQPSHLLKEALETAARAAGLRHVFGIEGVQNWFRSVHLQFGFTRRGFEERLPEWLAGQVCPVGVQTLRGSRSLRSKTFCEMWDALIDYRWANSAHGSKAGKEILGREKCRAVLMGSAWVMSEWVPELLNVALRRIDLGTSKGGQSVDAAPPEFLGPARLSWDEHDVPVFLTQVNNVQGFELSAAAYSVHLDGQTRAELLLQPDGLYHVEPEGDVRIDATHPVAHAELVDDGGVVQHITDVELWDPTEDITIFKLTNGMRERDPYEGLPTSGRYALLYRSDLELTPPPVRWARVAGGTFTLAQLSDDWRTARVAVLLGGEELWQARAKQDKLPPEPAWASQVHVERRQARVRLGEPLELWISHPEMTTVCFARIDGQSLAIVEEDSSTSALEPVVLDGEHRHGRLKVTLRMRRGEERLTLHREVHVAVDGVAMRDADGWRPVDSSAELDVRVARTHIFRMVPRQEDAEQSARSWGLLEGDTFVRRLSVYPSPLQGLAGLGGPLRVRYGPYNSVWSPMEVAAAVVNRGRVRSVGLDDGEQIAVVIDGHIEPDAHAHGVVWCDAEGGLCRTQPVTYRVHDDALATTWTIPRPEGASVPWAIGVEFRGERLGAWWDPTWPRAALGAGGFPPGELAALVRWLRLPILAPGARGSTLALAQEHPRAVVEAWILAQHLPSGLQHAEMDDAWVNAVRALLNVGDSSGTWLVEVFDALDEAGHADPDAFDRVARELMRINPVLMGRVLFAAACKYLVPAAGKPAAAGMLNALICRLAGCSGSAGDDAIQDAVGDLVTQVAFDVGIDQPADPGFVREALVSRALQRMGGQSGGSSTDELNVNLAMGIEPYRRLLAICVLRDKILPAFAI